MANRLRRDYRPQLVVLDDRCLLSNSPLGYTPAQIAHTYGLDAITFTSTDGTPVKGDGTGQTIALIEVDHDPNIQSDLAMFDRRFGLPDPPSFTVINLAGGETDSGWSLEESMDVESAHAIAPGANILVVEAAPSWSVRQQFENLMTAVRTAGNTPGVVAISMSWGFDEFPGETTYDTMFSTPGITYIAASGDSRRAEYPAASPAVLAVGGTSLRLDGSGSFAETAWIDSGGGYSLYEPEPTYQGAVQSTGRRSTPDVAFDGDPDTGVLVYATSPRTGEGTWQVVGGTSLGAPAWAAIIAIANQGRALAGLASLSGATQTLPTLYALGATDYFPTSPSSFATSGAGGGGLLSGGFGWWIGNPDPGSSGAPGPGATANTATGLGSPNGPPLIRDLAASTITSPWPRAVVTSDPGPTPAPAPTSTPIPSPTSPSNQHHRHKRHRHSTRPAHGHSPASHANRPVKTHPATGRKKPGLHHHPS